MLYNYKRKVPVICVSGSPAPETPNPTLPLRIHRVHTNIQYRELILPV